MHRRPGTCLVSEGQAQDEKQCVHLDQEALHLTQRRFRSIRGPLLGDQGRDVHAQVSKGR